MFKRPLEMTRFDRKVRGKETHGSKLDFSIWTYIATRRSTYRLKCTQSPLYNDLDNSHLKNCHAKMSNESSSPKRYTDPSYQAAHDDTYAHPLDPEIPRVLPPGVTRQQFDDALQNCQKLLGSSSSVYTGQELKDFVDPYELPEEGHGKKTAGAAIW